MDGWMDGCMDGWMDVCMDGWMYGWMDGWMLDLSFPYPLHDKHNFLLLDTCINNRNVIILGQF